MSTKSVDIARNIIAQLEADNTICSMCIISLLQTRRDLRINPFTSSMFAQWVLDEGFTAAHVNSAIAKLEKMNLLIAHRHKGKTWFIPVCIEDWQQDFWLWYYLPF